MKFKSKDIAYLLWLIGIFGWLGLHRFYLGKTGTGILWILTGGLFGFGSLFDLFTLGGKVEQYNTKIELETIRVATLNNISNQNTSRNLPNPNEAGTNNDNITQTNYSAINNQTDVTITELSSYYIVQGVLLLLFLLCLIYAIYDHFRIQNNLK